MTDSTLTRWSDANTAAALERWQQPLGGASRMLDVGRFALGQACPRCSGRRVYAVEQDKNLWLCIAQAMPVPWRRDQVTEHDAAEFADEEPRTHR